MARKLAIRKSSAPPTTFLTESFSGASHKRRSEGIGQLHRPCTSSLCPAAKLRLLPSSGQMENINAPSVGRSAKGRAAAFVMRPLEPSCSLNRPPKGDFRSRPSPLSALGSAVHFTFYKPPSTKRTLSARSGQCSFFPQPLYQTTQYILLCREVVGKQIFIILLSI